MYEKEFSDKFTKRFDLTFKTNKIISEGNAKFLVQVTDYSKNNFMGGFERVVEKDIIVDSKKPELKLLSGINRIRITGRTKHFINVFGEELIIENAEDALKQAADSLSKKGGTKKYDKVLKRIGRLQQKYASIAQYYEIDIRHKDQTATRIEWKFVKQEKAEQRFSGAYFLRTSRTDLDENAIWSIYTMLTNVEDAFRSLKSELDLRPIFHQKEDRSDAHLFITVLAYHLLNTIQTQLRQHDIHMQWWNIREHLSTHVRITTSMTTKDGRRIHIRQSSHPELFHRIIYDAVHLNYYPLGQRRTET